MFEISSEVEALLCESFLFIQSNTKCTYIHAGHVLGGVTYMLKHQKTFWQFHIYILYIILIYMVILHQFSADNHSLISYLNIKHTVIIKPVIVLNNKFN